MPDAALLSFPLRLLGAQLGANWVGIVPAGQDPAFGRAPYIWDDGSVDAKTIARDLSTLDAALASDVPGLRAVPIDATGAGRALLVFRLSEGRSPTDRDDHIVHEATEGLAALARHLHETDRLKQSEARLREAIDAAEVGTWDFDLDRNECWWSPRTCEIWGIEYADRLPGDLRYSFIHPDDKERYLREVDSAVFNAQPFAIEYRIVRSDGETRWVVLRGEAIGDSLGGPARATGIAIDITARREAQEHLRESRALLDAFMTNAPVGMYLKDPQSRYVMVNPKMGQVLGVPAEYAIGRTAAEILGDEEATRIEEEERRALATGRPQVRDQFFPEREENRSAMLMRFPVMLDGQAARIGGFAVDTTERLAAQAELERSREALHQAEKLTALGGLLAGVAHELNNPLAIMVAHAELLEDQLSCEEQLSDVRKIRRAADRCTRIVETFLAMARQQPAEQRDLNINALIMAALDIADYGLRTSCIEVSLCLAKALPRIMGEPSLVQQLLANLIVNAQQALVEKPSDRKLQIRTCDIGGVVAIDITDNAGGVPPETAKRIFDPFFTTKPPGKGTGLGLSFSLNVARSHGGSLILLDSSPNGTTFRVTLPAAEGTQERSGLDQAWPKSEDLPATGRRALVADDEPDIAEALGRMLDALGFSTVTAGSGREARLAIGRERFDLIITDLRMPEEDGAFLHNWLCLHHPELVERLIFVTGDALGSNAEQFLSRTGRPCITKPFRFDEVRRLASQLASGLRA